MVIVVEEDQAFERRATRFDTTRLPVPAELCVYTVDEWEAGEHRPGFVRTAADEMVWVWGGHR